MLNQDHKEEQQKNDNTLKRRKKKRKMRRKRKKRKKMMNLILTQGESQKEKGALRKRKMTKRMKMMKIPMITVVMRREKLQKTIQCVITLGSISDESTLFFNINILLSLFCSLVHSFLQKLILDLIRIRRLIRVNLM